MIGFEEKTRWWSYRRQRLGRRASDVGEVLSAVVAVYSSHPIAPLSLHARVNGFGAAGFRRLKEDRVALRLPAMRGSIYLPPRGSAHLAFRATEMMAQGRRLRYAGVCEERDEELKTVILEAAREPRTSRQPSGPTRMRAGSRSGR